MLSFMLASTDPAINKTHFFHYPRLIEITAIKDNWVLEFLLYQIKIRATESLPLGHNHERVTTIQGGHGIIDHRNLLKSLRITFEVYI